MTSPCPEMGCVGRYFGTPDAPCLTTIPMEAAVFSVTRIRRRLTRAQRPEVALPACEAYFLMLYLDDAEHADIKVNGERSAVRRYVRGSICLVDLRQGASIALHSDLSALAFVLPKTLIAEVAALSPTVKPQRLVCRRGEVDSILCSLGLALLALFERVDSSPPELLQHVAVAVCAHLLHHHSAEMQGDDGGNPFDGSNDPTAFHIRQEATRAPHQLQMRRRVVQAKQLLRASSLPLGSIAFLCGFSSLSHFTTVFLGETGTTPQAWRSAPLH